MIKKITLLLFLIFIGFGFIGNAQRAYFVNTKDSGTHVFWSDWVKSMNVSKIDMDSVKCAEFVTQEIWTCDTVVRFPLESIESITFEAPSTIYQPGVERLEEKLWDYITGYDEERNIISVDKDMDAKLLPTPGTKLCTTQLTEVFPIGFIGEVKDIVKGNEAIEIHCESVELTDIFKRYYSGYEEARQKMANSNGNPLKAPPLTGEKNLKFGPVEVPINLPPIGPSYKFDEENSLGFNFADSYAGVTFETNYKLRAYMIVDENSNIPIYMTLSGNGNHKLFANLDISGHLSYSWSEPLLQSKEMRGPGWFAFAAISFEAGPFFDLNFDTDMVMDISPEFNSSFRIIYSSEGVLNEALPAQSPVFKLVNNEFNFNSLNFSGQWTVGGFLKASVGFGTKKIAEGYVALKGGLRYTGDYTIPMSGISEAYQNSTFYDELKNVGGSFSFVVFPEKGFNLIGGKHWEFGFSDDIKVLVDKELFKIQLLPSFSNLKATRNRLPESSADLSFDVSGFCPYVYTIGGIASSKYEDNMWPSMVYSDDYYTPTFREKTYKFKLDLENKFHRYKVAPVINILGYDIMASPVEEVEEGIEIETLDAKEIGASSATIGGRVYDCESFERTPVPVFFYTEAGKAEWNSVEISSWNPSEQSEIYNTISCIKPETEYEYYFALKEDRSNSSPTVNGEVKRFRTKKEDICHVDFDLVYPICQHGGLGAEDKIHASGRFIRFEIATKPNLEDVEDGLTVLGQGAILYKNGKEISRCRLESPDNSYYQGHSIVDCYLQDPDLTIDNKNYIAKADKALYEAGMYFMFETKNGEIVEQRSDILKAVDFVYDTKPYCYTSWASYGNNCYEEPLYDNGTVIGHLHKHRINFYSVIRVGGTFWIAGEGPIDNQNDLYFVPYRETISIQCPLFNVEYSAEDAPMKEYASFVDVNGVAYRSNVIPLNYDSNGHAVDTVIDNGHTLEYLNYLNMELKWPWKLHDETWLNKTRYNNDEEISEFDSENKRRKVILVN